ncbi:MAG: calcium-binding protein [Planctomycetes bacterium]|nr:calcium-binding protein [Planctomycetota bacterium]MCP4861052.1 calcium-binding protein [Planctomycetota bacterium]
MNNFLSASLYLLAVLGGLEGHLSAQGVDRVSERSSGHSGNGSSTFPALSANGQLVVFESDASNLISGDTNGYTDVFFVNRNTGTPVRVSLDSTGAEANGDSRKPDMSADGQIIVFHSYASNLVANDTNGLADIFAHDRLSGITTRVSVSSSGAQGNSSSSECAISGDGRYVVFASNSSNLVSGDTNGINDVFLHDRQTGNTSRVSVDSSGTEANHSSGQPVISADGTTIGFASDASNLVANDTNGNYDIFVHEPATGQTNRVSLKSGGAQADGYSGDPGLSADGTIVVFTNDSTTLVPGDRNGMADVYTHDRATSMTTRVSVNSQGVAGGGWSGRGTISDDGLFVAFDSYATDLITEDLNSSSDVFLHDRLLGLTTNMAYSKATTQGSFQSFHAAISSDGSVVAFDDFSAHLVLGDTNFAYDVFVNDRNTYPNLAKFGTCPGPVQLTVSNATPGGNVAIIYGSHGIFRNIGGCCNGLILGVLNPTIGAVVQADPSGMVSLSFNARSQHCWTSIQAVDIQACLASNRQVL